MVQKEKCILITNAILKKNEIKGILFEFNNVEINISIM